MEEWCNNELYASLDSLCTKKSILHHIIFPDGEIYTNFSLDTERNRIVLNNDYDGSSYIMDVNDFVDLCNRNKIYS